MSEKGLNWNWSNRRLMMRSSFYTYSLPVTPSFSLTHRQRQGRPRTIFASIDFFFSSVSWNSLNTIKGGAHNASRQLLTWVKTSRENPPFLPRGRCAAATHCFTTYWVDQFLEEKKNTCSGRLEKILFSSSSSSSLFLFFRRNNRTINGCF